MSLDLHLAIAAGDLARAEALLREEFVVAAFAERAVVRDVLGLSLPVAAIEDVLLGKVWAAQDPGRRPSKRQKDLADISRLLEERPELRSRVPADILSRLI